MGKVSSPFLTNFLHRRLFFPDSVIENSLVSRVKSFFVLGFSRSLTITRRYFFPLSLCDKLFASAALLPRRCYRKFSRFQGNIFLRPRVHSFPENRLKMLLSLVWFLLSPPGTEGQMVNSNIKFIIN